MAVRDFLRSHPNVASAYGKLKKRLARKYPKDIDAYVDGKTDFILKILAEANLTADELASIADANRKG